MKYIFVKKGQRQSLPHDDFLELVNYREDVPALIFWKLTPPGLRMVGNPGPDSAANPYAIAHYVVDPTRPVQSPIYLKSIDTSLLLEAADKYEYVMGCIIAPIGPSTTEQSLERMQYIARVDGRLIDVATDQVIDETKAFAVTSLFGFVRVVGFPMYYMILNQDLVRVNDSIDMYDPARDLTWFGLTPADGTLAERLFAPAAIGATLIDKTVVTDSPSFQIDLFGHFTTFFYRRSRAGILKDAQVTINSNLVCHINDDGVITVDVPYDITVGYIDVHFNCGPFFEMASPCERFQQKFIVHRARQ